MVVRMEDHFLEGFTFLGTHLSHPMGSRASKLELQALYIAITLAFRVTPGLFAHQKIPAHADLE